MKQLGLPNGSTVGKRAHSVPVFLGSGGCNPGVDWKAAGCVCSLLGAN